ncbi:MAG: DUF2845 domain-containing protein [Marinobacter sp.]|uniref:DUF2845 domain-containing protein n=1 Tax=Marinobacter sp. TaxID=50741 RepID=UPI0032983708
MRLLLSIRLLGLILLPGLAVLPGTGNTAFRCGSSLVDVGDWPVEVEERCGAPDYVATYPTATVPGVGVVGEVEHWYYNPGPHGFIRRLEFRDGKLRSEHSLGYGFSGDSAGDCSPARLQSGVSEFEMVAYCGEPVSRRVTWEAIGRGSDIAGHYRPGTLVPVEEWMYETGKTQFRRIIRMRNGRVTHVETTRKPRGN